MALDPKSLLYGPRPVRHVAPKYHVSGLDYFWGCLGKINSVISGMTEAKVIGEIGRKAFDDLKRHEQIMAVHESLKEEGLFPLMRFSYRLDPGDAIITIWDKSFDEHNRQTAKITKAEHTPDGWLISGEGCVGHFARQEHNYYFEEETLARLAAFLNGQYPDGPGRNIFSYLDCEGLFDLIELDEQAVRETYLEIQAAKAKTSIHDRLLLSR